MPLDAVTRSYTVESMAQMRLATSATASMRINKRSEMMRYPRKVKRGIRGRIARMSGILAAVYLGYRLR